MRLAELGECAAQTGRFWEFHDALFRRPVSTADPDVTNEVDAALRGECTVGGAVEEVVSDLTSGRELRVRVTPTFFIGTLTPDREVRVDTAWSGGRTLAAFRAEIDRLCVRHC
jgi:protein-disulfide isomerase